jgi:hypothetical protein
MENINTNEENQMMNNLVRSIMNYDTTTPLMQVNKSEQMMQMAKAYQKPKPVIVERKKRSMFDGYEEVIRYLRAGKKLSWKEIHAFFNQSGLKCNYQTLMKFAIEKKIGSHPKNKKRNKKFLIVN